MLQVLKENKILQKVLSWAGLFGSFGTLLCCALPSTLVHCEGTKGWSKSVFWISFGINLIGAFYAFLLPRVLG